MRNKKHCKHFGCFLTFVKILSFHISTKSDSLSRVFRNFVVDKKNFMISSFKQKKNQLVWLNRDGDIQNSYRKDTYGPPCMWIWLLGQIHIYGVQFNNRYRIANHAHHFSLSTNPSPNTKVFGPKCYIFFWMYCIPSKVDCC